MNQTDITIVGAGPAGTVTALYLLQAGLKPLILEKEPFPRYHIGESLTGECGNCLRELGLEQQMQSMGWPVKYGVKVYGAGGENSFWVPVNKRNQDNQLEEASTWQVRRSDFDRMLLKTAIERGARFVEGKALSPIIDDDRVTGIHYQSNDGTDHMLNTKVLVDASGQSTFMANNSNLTSVKEKGRYDRQVAVFSQVKHALRDPGTASGNTLIFVGKPYHWAWFIPLDDEVTSVGVVVPKDYFRSKAASPEEFLESELKVLNPELARRLKGAVFTESVRTLSNYSYHVKRFTGNGFLCVGDSHRFIDPIFSYGVYFSVKEAQMAAQAIERSLKHPQAQTTNPFAEYQKNAERGQDVIQDLLDCFWLRPLAFMIFVHYQYREGFIDLFAGRIYDKDVADNPAIKAIRQQLVSCRTAASNQLVHDC